MTTIVDPHQMRLVSRIIPIPSEKQLEVTTDLPHPSSSTGAVNEPTHRMLTRSKSGIVKPKVPYTVIACLVSQIENSAKPKTVSEALQSPHWKEAMESEFVSEFLKQNLK